jgi:hypothetical protein
MAKINSHTVVITVSELLPDTKPAGVILDISAIEALHEAVKQLAGEHCLVEIADGGE